MAKKTIKKEQVKGVHQATVERYWQVWATHVENDSTLVETAHTFGYKSISQVCRILKWCARQLQTDTPLETVQAQIWNKRKRLRLIRAKRAQCMDGNMHTETLGYLREERECENDIAKLEGAERQLISLEVTGKDGGPVQATSRLTLDAAQSLAVVEFLQATAQTSTEGDTEAGDDSATG